MKRFFNFVVHISKSIKLCWDASPHLFLLRLLIEMISVAIPIISAFLLKLLIDNLSNMNLLDDNKRSVAIPIIIVSAIITAAGLLLGRLSQLITVNHQDLINNQITMQIIEKVNSLDLSYFDSPKLYNEIQNARRDSGSLSNLSWIVVSIVKAATQVISISLLLSSIGAMFPLLILAFNIPSAIVDRYMAKRRYEWERDMTSHNRKMEYIRGILDSQPFSKDMRVFGNYNFFSNSYKGLWRAWFKERRMLDRKRFAFSIAASLIPYLPIAYMMYYLCIQIIDRKLSIGDFAFYSGIASQFSGGLASLVQSFNQGYESEMRLINYYNFLNWEPRIQNHGTLIVKHIDLIEFQNVSFTYPNTKNHALANVSFTVNKMEKVALVGTNGSGKSTIVKLLLRLYEPDEGKILINGYDIKDFDLSILRQSFGIVFQDFNKYYLRMSDVITLEDTACEKSETNIHSALHNADIDISSDSFVEGIDTHLGKIFDDNGVELSGGQWQKVAIAQAYYKNAMFMVMDEPSASLDPESEDRVFKSLMRLCSDKGALFITHRLSSVSAATKIVVMDAGVCVEVGSHKDLIKNNGVYAKLYSLQANKYTMQ